MVFKKLILGMFLVFLIPLVLALTLTITQVDIDNNLNGSHDIAITDIDDDGNLDIIAGAYVDGIINWYEQISSTSWTKHLVTDNLTNAHDVQVGDIDGDGNTDIIGLSLSGNWSNYNQANGSLWWYENDDPKTDYWNAYLIHEGNRSWVYGLVGARAIDLYDMDTDGDLDVVVGLDANTYLTRGALDWYENPGGASAKTTANWNAYRISNTVPNLADVQAFDFDYDGNVDVATAEHHPENNGRTRIWFSPFDNTVENSFKNTTISFNASYHLTPTDFDGDGWMDLVVAHYVHEKISWYKHPGTPLYYIHVDDNDTRYGYLEAPNSETLNQSFTDMTVSTWFTPSAVNFTGDKEIFSRLYHKSSYQMAPSRSNSYILFQWENDTGDIKAITTDKIQWNPGHWYNLILNINGSNGKINLYVDGLKQSTTGVLDGTLEQTGDVFRIGDNNDLTRAFNGSIGKTKIWNVSLNESQIATEYALGRGNETNLTDNLILYYNMRGGNDTTMPDYSGEGNNATIFGALRDNSVRNQSAWIETVVDAGDEFSNLSLSVVAYDIDGDGDLDIGAVTEPGGPGGNGYVMWYERTNEAGTAFTRTIMDDNQSRTSWAHDLKIDDINGDGYGDLILASASADYVSLYLMNVAEVATSTSVNSDLTQSILKILIGFLSLVVLGTGLFGIFYYTRNNWNEMSIGIFFGYAVTVLIGVVLMIALMNYIVGLI